MAVENYNPIVLNSGECLGQDWFQPTYESLAALEQAAKDGAGSFECVHFSGHISADTSLGEICEQAIGGAQMPKEYPNGNQICCLILSFSGNMQSPAVNLDLPFGLDVTIPENVYQYPYQDIEVTIKCSGQPITTTGGKGTGAISATLDPTTCDFNSGIEICTDAYTGANSEIPYTFKWCGCLICVQCPPLPLTDYYIPRQSNPNCEYGLGDLAQVIHVLNQMNAAFRCAGYEVECVTRDQISGSSPIAQDLTTETKWIGLACSRLTWTGNLQFGSVVKSNVTMGCSQRPISCNNSVKIENVIAVGGAEIFTVACGECQPGESIWFGSSPEYHCAQVQLQEEDDEPVIVQGESDVLFWVFRKQVNDLPNIPQLTSGCVFDDTAEAITTAAENINQAACNIQKINKDPVAFSGVVDNGQCSVVIPAQPWPPPTPPPRPVPDPPPVKKWFFYGTVQVIAVAFDTLNTGYFSYQIRCGGAIVHDGPDWYWQFTAVPTAPARSQRVPICAIVECPIDQPIEVCIGSTGGANVKGIFSGTALCISQA